MTKRANSMFYYSNIFCFIGIIQKHNEKVQHFSTKNVHIVIKNDFNALPHEIAFQ